MNYKTKKGEKAFQGECDLAGAGGLWVGGAAHPPQTPGGMWEMAKQMGNEPKIEKH